ncbi:MAG TPA: hypothetical protein VK976_17065 [Verrucomicrobiae bacterium]|nr:hypothetical protein [Verrucomicrobiae bacterium]
MRKSFGKSLGLLLVVAAAAPLALAQSVRRVPEGGSDLAYLLLAGVSCAGAVWYRYRRSS